MRGAMSPFSHTSSCRGAYLSTGYVFMAWYLDNPRDNFTFTYVYNSVILL